MSRVAFQGAPGAYSEIAADSFYPDAEKIGCSTFKNALSCLDEGRADYAVIPVTNTTAGPVTNALLLLHAGNYTVMKSGWQNIHHCLLALPEARPEGLRTVQSHWQALKQCQNNIKARGLQAIEAGDTAAAANFVASCGDVTHAAIASSLAAKTYGLQIIAENFEDNADNRTLFLVLAREAAAENIGTAKDVLKELGL